MTHEEKVKQLLHAYRQEYSSWVSFGQSVHSILLSLLEQKKVDYHGIDYRIKDAEQFIEKAQRNSYKNPLREMHDVCWVRIVCYFHQDVARIIKLIEKVFDVVEVRNTGQPQDATKFWYRSDHIVVSLPKSWSEVPAFRDYANFKVEIQVRTILMHAWAEIEHRLAYKRQEHIPHHLRRKFSRISAKLEEADEQFEELAQEIRSYEQKQEDIFLAWDGSEMADVDPDLNTLQACMNAYLPDEPRNTKDTHKLLEYIMKNKKKTWDISKELKKSESKQLWDKNKSQAQITQEVLNDT